MEPTKPTKMAVPKPDGGDAELVEALRRRCYYIAGACFFCGEDKHTAHKSDCLVEQITAALVPRDDGRKLPIDRPCSACSAGDTEMEYHDHYPPFRADPAEQCPCPTGKWGFGGTGSQRI